MFYYYLQLRKIMGCETSYCFTQNQDKQNKKPSNQSHKTDKQVLDLPQQCNQQYFQRKKELIKEGNNYLKQVNISKAINVYKEAIQLDLKTDYQILGLGAIENQIGYYEHNTIQLYFAKCSEPTPYDSLAICFMLSQEYESAQKWYGQMIDSSENNYQLILGRGHIYINNKEYERAKQQYFKVLEINPKLDKTYELIAFILKYQKAQNEEVLLWAEKCLKINNNNVYALFLLTVCEHNVKKKIEGLKKINKKFPCFGRAYNSLGNVYKRKKQHEQAIIYYKNCIQLCPKYDAPYNGLGNIYRQKKQFGFAIEMYEKSIEINPKSDNPYNGLGNVLNELEEYDRAIQNYEKCIEINDKFDSAFYGIGIAKKNKGLTNEAIIWFQKSIQINSKDQLYVGQLANIYILLEDYDKAFVLYQKNVDINPSSSNYANLGKIEEKRGNCQSSKEYYQKSIQIDSNYIEGYYELGNLYRKQSQTQKAVQFYKKSIAINNEFQPAYYELGKLYKNKKIYDKANQWYQKCLKINKSNEHTLNALGNIQNEQGNYENARQWYQKAIRANQNFSAPYYGLGNINFILSSYDQSISAYKKCIQLSPQNDHPYTALGNIFKTLKQYDEAIFWYNSSLKINPNNDASYYGLGNVYSYLGNLQKAQQIYLMCLVKNQNHPLCCMNLGIVYLKMENFKDAFRYFCRARDTINLDQRLSQNNRQYIQEHLQKFRLQAQDWQTKKQTGFISQEDKNRLNNIINNFQSKVKYIYKADTTKNISLTMQKKLLNADFIKIVGIIFQDKFKLQNISDIFQSIKNLFQLDQDYFHIITLLFCQYFWIQKFKEDRHINDIENQLSMMISSQSQKYSKIKQNKLLDHESLANCPIQLTMTECSSRKINLFKDTSFFPSYQELYSQIVKINSAACKSFQEFQDLVESVKTTSKGFNENVSQKIPNDTHNQFKVMLRIMQKMFKEIKGRKNELISKLDKHLSQSQNTSLSFVLHSIVKVWTDEIDIILADRMKDKIATPFYISDLIRGKCLFHSINDIQNAIAETERICINKGYQILQFQNRLTKPETRDIVLKIYIKEAVCQLQLGLKQNAKQYHFIHCIYELQRSPLGCIFGSYLFLSKGFKYPFVEQCRDIMHKLKGKTSLKDRVLAKKIKYILNVVEDIGKSVIK